MRLLRARWEPLSAVYHRRCLEAADRSHGTRVLRKITDALADLAIARWAVDDGSVFENLNTPEEWAGYHDAH